MVQLNEGAEEEEEKEEEEEEEEEDAVRGNPLERFVGSSGLETTVDDEGDATLRLIAATKGVDVGGDDDDDDDNDDDRDEEAWTAWWND